jgi:microcystin-dependent protein
MAEIIITTNDRRVQFTAAGGQTAFPFDFPVFADAELQVIRVRAGVTATLTLSTDYTVSGVGLAAGGTVTLTAGALANDKLTVAGLTPKSRTTDFQEGGDFRAVTINAELDRLTLMVQELQRDLDLKLGVPLTFVGGSASLPTPSSGKLIGWNALADALENVADNINIIYKAQSAQPTSPLDGMLWFDTAADVMKVYNATAATFQVAAASLSFSINTFLFNASAGQTTFTGADANGAVLAYFAGAIEVFQNGVRLLEGAGKDFTATNGTSVVLAAGAVLNDELVIVARAPYQSVDHYTKAQSDAAVATALVPYYTKTQAKDRYGDVGDLKPWIGAAEPTGWLFLSGKTLGNAASGGTARANADTTDLFAFLWTNLADAEAPVSGGRGASAAADFAANKTITLPDMRGRTLIGKDNMGGTAANRVTAAIAGLDATVLGRAGGDQRLTAHAHGAGSFVDGAAAKGIESGTVTPVNIPNMAQSAGPGVADDVTVSVSITRPGANQAVTGTSANAGAGASENLPPAIVVNMIIRYLAN